MHKKGTVFEAIGDREKAMYSRFENIRPLYWALSYHKNIRGETLDFALDAGANYLWDLYKIIDKTPHMVVEKSVQCFEGSTLILTSEGYRPLDTVDVGDLVLTHEGRYRKVVRVFERKYSGKMIRRRAEGLESILSTPEHPFLGYKGGDIDDDNCRWSHKYTVGDFVCRAKLPKPNGHYLDIDVPTYSKPKPTLKAIRKDDKWFIDSGQGLTRSNIPLDFHFGRLIGLYLMYGWRHRNRLSFAYPVWYKFLDPIICKEIEKFRDYHRGVIKQRSRNAIFRKVFVISYALVDLFEQFGSSETKKRIPEDLLELGSESFIRGIFNGCMMHHDCIFEKDSATFCTVSEELSEQISRIGNILGWYGVGRWTETDKEGKTLFYTEFSVLDEEKTIGIDTDRWIASEIIEYSEEDFSGRVYDLEVDGDHSYVANDYIVHNCGLSELFIIQSHIEAGERGMSVMYVLPKYELRNRFVNNRIYKLHKRVDHYKYLVYKADTKVHRTSLMHFGDGTLAYVGSNVADEFIEIPVDSCFVDEKDRCNLANLLMLPDRLTASPYQFEREISNPTIEGFGIDERYLESSQGVWKIKCPACGTWFTPDFFQHVVRETSSNVFVPRDPNADPDPLCAKEIGLIHDCGCSVDRLGPGEWVHAHPSRLWQGFRVSKLFAQLSAKANLRNLYSKWVKSVGNELKTQIFYNSDLGLPFSSKGARITRVMLNDCIRNYQYPPVRVNKTDKRFMGIDVGSELHVILRGRSKQNGEITYPLLGIWVLPGFTQLVRIIREWKPDRIVIDAMPELHKVMELKADFSNVWSSRFQVGAATLSKNENKRELTMDRTALLDYVRQDVELKALVNPLKAEFLEDGSYYAHMIASTRILEVNDAHPEKSRFVWKEGSKPDHFFLAEAYCRQAGMIMPDHSIFDFFDSQSKSLKSHADKRNVTGAPLSEDERQKIADLQKLTPEVALSNIHKKNAPKVKKPVVDDEKIRDVIDYMYNSQKYVDVTLAAQMSGEDQGDVVRVLSSLNFKQSRIAGQWVKGGR